MAGPIRVDSLHTHLAWDNALQPVAEVAPGDEFELELIDASGGQIGEADGVDAVGRLDFSAVNPCTGPIRVVGAEPGDDLVVTVLDIVTAGWGWTANIPGFGLLADDFPAAHLRISPVRDGRITFAGDVEIPARPMIGTIGVPPAAAGQTPLLVPTEAGGNMDIPQLGIGTTVHFPVRVPGALLSAGDTHAVQGDGEVCGTGVETSSTLRLRVDLGQGQATESPWYTHGPSPAPAPQSAPTARSAPAAAAPGEWAATTGIGPDLFVAARDATRRAVDLVARSGLAPIDAYLLLSLVGELRVSEIVDAPNWVVSMHVPTRYLG